MNGFAVKASGQDRTRSLKVTIPAEVARRFDINPGDTFWIEVEDDDALVLKYVRTSDGTVQRHPLV